MRMVTGDEFEGIVAGGSGLGGAYVWVTYRANGKDVTLIFEKGRVGAMMVGLATAAAKARTDRVTANPAEANASGLDTAYALEVDSLKVGRSTVPERLVLDVLIRSDMGLLDLYLSADRAALLKMRAAINRALSALEKRVKPVKAN